MHWKMLSHTVASLKAIGNSTRFERRRVLIILLAVLEALEPGKYEHEIKAVFDYHQIKTGLMQDAYNGIFAGGENSAILHYVENNRQIKDGDLFLIDAGYECKGYASDFTRTYPANGEFTSLQAEIYEAVLEAQKQVIESSKPNVKMEARFSCSSDDAGVKGC